MQTINWKLFQTQFGSASEDQQVRMVAMQLPNFDTKPEWVSGDVWSAAIRQGGKNHATHKNSST
jgi:hypothetical protein